MFKSANPCDKQLHILVTQVSICLTCLWCIQCFIGAAAMLSQGKEKLFVFPTSRNRVQPNRCEQPKAALGFQGLGLPGPSTGSFFGTTLPQPLKIHSSPSPIFSILHFAQAWLVRRFCYHRDWIQLPWGGVPPCASMASHRNMFAIILGQC